MSYQSLPESMRIIDFWFSSEVQPLWFDKNPDFDEVVRLRFGDIYHELVRKLRDEGLDTLNVDLEDALAFVIILDQLPRNMFRDTPEAFASDDLALSLSKTIIRKGIEEKLPSSAHYNFLYMPFMHSESLNDQEEGIRLFSSIPGNEQTVAYANHHRDIIAQFGRFPHRNKILGRSSTPEEQEYLKDFQGF